MLEQGRYPTHEEIEVVIARARLLRSLYVSALIKGAWRRAKELLAGAEARRGTGAGHYYPDMG